MDFPQGFFFKLPHEKAPDFIKGKLHIKVQEAIDWLTGVALNNEDWITLDLKVSLDGNAYASVSEYKPNGKPKEEPFELPGETEEMF